MFSEMYLRIQQSHCIQQAILRFQLIFLNLQSRFQYLRFALFNIFDCDTAPESAIRHTSPSELCSTNTITLPLFFECVNIC